MIHRLRQIAILVIGYSILLGLLAGIVNLTSYYMDPGAAVLLQHRSASYQQFVLSRPVIVFTASFWSIFFAVWAGVVLVDWRETHEPTRQR